MERRNGRWATRLGRAAGLTAGGMAAWFVVVVVGGAGPPASGPRASGEALGAEAAPVAGGPAQPPQVPAVAERSLVGVLAAPESVEIVAAEPGRITVMNVAAGDVVERGELLAEISLEDLEARRRIEAARVRESQLAVDRTRLEVDLGRRRVERREGYPELFSLEDREDAQLQLERALLDEQVATARRSAAEAELGLVVQRIARGRVLAPLDGVVIERLVDAGTTVSAGSPILQVVDAAALIVRFAVPASEVHRYAPGTAVRVSLSDPPRETCAPVRRVSPQLDEGSRLVFVEASLATGAMNGVPLGSPVAVQRLDETCS